MASSDCSLAGWIFDASKLIPSFVSAVALLWVKDVIESRAQRRRTRRALWKMLCHESPCHESATVLVAVLESAIGGDFPEGEGAIDEGTAAMLKDAQLFDPDNTAAYSRLRFAESANQRAAIAYYDAQTRQLPSGDNFPVVSAAHVFLESFDALGHGRLAVLRVLQVEEADPEVRTRVLLAAEHDAQETHAIVAGSRSSLVDRGIIGKRA